jgi:hypothetical protein
MTLLHVQSDARDDKTRCGVEGLLTELGGRPALLTPQRYGFKLALEGEPITCRICAGGVRAARTVGWATLLRAA